MAKYGPYSGNGQVLSLLHTHNHTHVQQGLHANDEAIQSDDRHHDQLELVSCISPRLLKQAVTSLNCCLLLRN